MPTWPRSAASVLVNLVVLAGALTLGCSSSTPGPIATRQPSTTAPPAEEPAGLVPVTVQVPAGLAQSPLDVPRDALVPPGWTMSVWARTPRPRLAAWAPDGALLVSVPSSGQVLRFAPQQDAAPRQSVLLEGIDTPHGLAFAGSMLYVAESDQVNSYTYADGATRARRVVADGLPDARSPDLGGEYSHALKSVAVGPDGAVYFSIGSTGNITANDRNATPQRATIMRIPPGGGPFDVFSTGVRNGTGLAVAPDGSVWTAVNNRDNVEYPYPGDDYGDVIQAYVNDHPPESLARLTPGRELGWPYCNPDGDGGNARFIRDVETNADGAKMDCAKLPPVEQTLGAHAAPLGLSFTDGVLPGPYAHGALVGVHGSWNREPPRAPEVSFFAWENGSLRNQQTLVGGFQAANGERWGRPVGAVVGPDGAVYITDDYADAIYRLVPPGR